MFDGELIKHVIKSHYEKADTDNSFNGDLTKLTLERLIKKLAEEAGIDIATAFSEFLPVSATHTPFYKRVTQR